MMKGLLYDSLLELFNQQNDWDSWEQLFSQSANFLKKIYQTEISAVVSLPLKFDSEAQFRLIWDSTDGQGLEETLHFFSPLLNNLRVEEHYETLLKDNFTIHAHEQRKVLFLGRSKRQNFFFLFDDKNSSHREGEQVFALFTRYLVKSFRHIMKFNQILEMNSLIYIDDVTGLYNQRKLLADLDHLMARPNDTKGFSVFFIDVDHFKLVNDGHGHLIGTKVLREMAGLFKICFRESDYLYRYGGDEFVALVPDIDFMQAELIGERILQQVSEHTFAGEESLDLKISISIGIALYPRDTKDRKEILSLADKMMYQAKAEGRGKVCAAQVIVR
jgi:diguanylate cyclase (GGDEF)-like protein